MGFRKRLGGTVTVTAVIQAEKLIEITADGPNETPDRGGVACVKLPEAMVTANSIAVDAIAGATITSNAIKSAMEDILQQAGLGEAIGAVQMKPGIYVGEGNGFDWIEPVRVKIVVDETKLLSIEVIELELNRRTFH
jgi:fumarate reductase flavoprotein subunit